MKTIVVTDIHGCLEELESVWAQAGFDPETDKLICLGDLMDRGPYSFGVFDRFRSLKRKMGERCIMILGNHDDMMMNSFYGPVVYARWMRNQGQTTLDSFEEHHCDLENSFAGSMKCVRIMRMRMPFLFMPDWCMRSQKKILCMI